MYKPDVTTSGCVGHARCRRALGQDRASQDRASASPTPGLVVMVQSWSQDRITRCASGASSAIVQAPVTPTVRQPALRAERTPATVSSTATTTPDTSRRPSSVSPLLNGSGSGLLAVTSSPVTKKAGEVSPVAPYRARATGRGAEVTTPHRPPTTASRRPSPPGAPFSGWPGDGKAAGKG